jgi:hypothetical protein
METTNTNQTNRPDEVLRMAARLRSTIIGIFVVIITVSMIGVFGFGVTTKPPGFILDGGAQIGLVSLVIALAAYLATVGREVKAGIKVAGDGERVEDQKNLEGIICAEQLVVALGLLVTLRIIVRPFLEPTLMVAKDIPVTVIDFIDVLLMSVFVGVVFFLAWLHCRQWR